MRENLEGKLRTLPRSSGVYLFRDAAGEVLYVGKAKSLRPRVRSYFQRGDTRFGAARLAERVDDVEVIVTRTEAEALHLEQNLVKRHRPPFNIRLRDDKSFPYITVTLTDEYPRVMFTRERHRRGNALLRPVREREEGARDARRAQPRLSLPPVRGAATRAALGNPVPRLPHRPLLRAVHRRDLEGGVRRGDRRRRRLPLRRHADDPGRARRSACGRRRRTSGSRRLRATGTVSSRSATSPIARRPSGARSARSTSSGSPSTATRPPCRSSRSATGR